MKYKRVFEREFKDEHGRRIKISIDDFAGLKQVNLFLYSEKFRPKYICLWSDGELLFDKKDWRRVKGSKNEIRYLLR